MGVRRTRGDDVEHSAHRRAAARETDITDGLFATEQAAGARDAAINDTDRKAQIARDIERLKPHVLIRAKMSGPAHIVGNPHEDGAVRGGITVADVRKLGEDRGILTGQETGRQLSWLGPAMKSFGLVATTYVRRSQHRVERSHGNRHTVYVHPDFADQIENR